MQCQELAPPHKTILIKASLIKVAQLYITLYKVNHCIKKHINNT
jgi:hypothetical protein